MCLEGLREPPARSDPGTMMILRQKKCSQEANQKHKLKFTIQSQRMSKSPLSWSFWTVTAYDGQRAFWEHPTMRRTQQPQLLQWWAPQKNTTKKKTPVFVPPKNTTKKNTSCPPRWPRFCWSAIFGTNFQSMAGWLSGWLVTLYSL